MPAIKGKYGELKVASTLSSLPKNKYIVLNNIMLVKNRHSSQIDHIVISPYGIFVIETKNYKGEIYGRETVQYWTQTIGNNEYPLYNPLWQNKTHIKYIAEALGNHEDIYHSIVVFVKASNIKVTGASKNVIPLEDLIKHISKHKKRVMKYAECTKIANRLKHLNVSNPFIRKSHKKRVKQAVKYSLTKESTGICPRCGGHLVTRVGKNNLFQGCSNYPKCKYTTK